MKTLIFVTGGVRSGKSHFAEQLVKARGVAAAYVATSEAFDVEMKSRIEKHQQDRSKHAFNWQLYEMPYALSTTISERVVLFECVTTWLANMFFMQNDQHAIQTFKAWIEQLLDDEKYVVIVSNEMLDAGLTEYEETNMYLQQIGQLHTWLVEKSDEAYECNNTILKRWK